MGDAMGYDAFGAGYAGVRVADPYLAEPIWASLSDARSVINVGAGAGSYEPQDRQVIAIEPSRVMIMQRPSDAASVIQAAAEALPFEDDAVDAALAVLTIHHWDGVEVGLDEMLRVARKRIVLVTMDGSAFSAFWLARDYLPELVSTHASTFPPIEWLLQILPGSSVAPLAVPRNCTDGMMVAFWGRPEAYLDPKLRSPSSPWHQLPAGVVARGLAHLKNDLATGEWDRRYGHLREEVALDVGLRLVVSEFAAR